MIESEKPTLIIPLESWKKVKGYVDVCDTEITGFADVEYNDELEAFVMGEVYLVDQVAGGADVEMDEDQIADFMVERMKAGAEQMPRIWWHSHVNMAAFFSATDEHAMTAEFQSDTFTIALVLNKRGEMKANLLIYESVPEDSLLVKLGFIKNPVRVDGININILYEDIEVAEALKKEVEKKVKTRKVREITTFNSRGGYTFGPGRGKSKKKIHTNQLPKDPALALAKIVEFNLKRTWSSELRTIVYVSPSGVIWEDKWEVITILAYTEIKDGVNDTDWSEMEEAYRPVGLVCSKCGYMEEFHNEDLCAAPVFVKKSYDSNPNSEWPYSGQWGDEEYEDDKT